MITHRIALLSLSLLLGAFSSFCSADDPLQNSFFVTCSTQHHEALDHPRRVVMNYDALSHFYSLGAGKKPDLDHVKEHLFGILDLEGSQIDTVLWCWGAGNWAPFLSDVMPLRLGSPAFNWLPEGIDILDVCVEETHRRGLEAFYTHRINAADNEVGKYAWTPTKKAHPEWLINWNPDPNGPPERNSPWEPMGFWDFSVPEVREHKVRVLRDVLERRNFDGVEINYARNPACLPPGHQWEHRHHLTEFMRAVRKMAQEIAVARGRPLLVGARVPENLIGCHFDGLDVETWAREGLVDILSPGSRSLDVDITAFRRITVGTPIKIFPCNSWEHTTDGYTNVPTRVWYGMVANWWHDQPDGVHTFNLNYQGQDWKIYQVIGSPQTLQHVNKTFVLQRRGGGHGMIPSANNWRTPRLFYFLTNMQAPLPAAISGDGKTDTLLTLKVADDVNSMAERIDSILLRLLITDRLSKTLRSALPAPWRHNGEGFYGPPAADYEKTIEIRLNNLLLKRPCVENDWLLLDVQPIHLAIGDNLLGICWKSPDAGQKQILQVELVELDVNYKPN